ncbi:MAG TPA: TRAM domain-containing protein [Epulopiscium sp.]|nr:TRAM domain-containing protein [Candidatus Epulonipiscium sp.]
MRKTLRWIMSGAIGLLGLLPVSKLYEMGMIPENVTGIFSVLYSNIEIIIFIIIGSIAFFTVANPIARKISYKLESILEENTLQEILISVISIAIGLGIANLIGNAFGPNKKYTPFILLLYIGLGYFGYHTAQSKVEEIKRWFSKKPALQHNVLENEATPKILDTSVIIDGRIVDILKTGFIEGRIVIPVFVLEELRHIADSSDGLKRNRGRRGLDILNEIKENLAVQVDIVEKDYKTIKEVDSKLIKLAEELNGALVTNDYNLNKVASFQKMKVLNINDLANAVKPVVLPGEEMHILVSKEGKEDTQGIGYLNDGTMIVVEGGRKYVGETIEVIVTTVLQTAAGRMIFAKLKGTVNKLI